MSRRLVWQDAAKDDLQQFLDYLQRKNPRACIDYIFEVENAANGLLDFPEQGRDYSRRYRALVVRNHLIFYRYDMASETIVISRVVDGRRDLPRILG